ncbi:SDR family oxidoreductase [Pontibacter cellulosilyticus]|uniref:SDR family oxidoreductase n=1 Tax=Pontibacter cellulosilyticus TaxID=1720253 RepID=A0A923N8F7_9BACT|nr:SDR family oxidoreductase [Pontibacter cellulosilyticus]MBC5994113.1 SDR family oxidoreductase [Pontibacter cellulosilyticus]
MKLKDKVAIVTGASQGIGKATAKVLAEAGAKVVLAARHADDLKEVKQEIESKGGEATIAETDVTDLKQVEAMAQIALDKYGTIDILVNSAGLMPLSYMKNRHLEEWEKMVDVNLKGILKAVYAVLPTMIQNKSGHIVNMASIDGRVMYRGGAVYGATKAAIIALSEGLRMELSPDYNIRITSVEPGTVDTDLRESITDKELLNDMDWDNGESKLEPEDIADSILYALTLPNRANVNEILLKPAGKQ